MSLSATESAVVLAALAVSTLLLWQIALQLLRLGIRAAERLPAKVTGSRAWARTHPMRAMLAARYPRTVDLLGRRLAPRRFTGLPLTLMVAAAIYVVALIGGLVEELFEATEINAIDRAINAFFNPLRSDALVTVFNWLTMLGDSAALLAVVIVANGFLWAHRRRPFIGPLWLTFLGAVLTAWAGKFALDRERPEFLTMVEASFPSFPSGHATGAMAVYGFVAYAIARDLAHPRERFEVTFWTLVLIALIGFSRIFLSVHYASDVAAGFLVGGFWLLVGFALSEYQLQRDAAG